MEFTHLHVHSHYSLFDGAMWIPDLVRQARRLGMQSLALTDHDTLMGAVEFHHAAIEAGVKPILGMEATVVDADLAGSGSSSQSTAHILLLAMNETGWQNLVNLASAGWTTGPSPRFRLSRNLLFERTTGLVCTSGCMRGGIAQAMLDDRREEAVRLASAYREAFGPERFYIEIQNTGLEDQCRLNHMLAELARETGVGIVGTNNVHFLQRADRASQALWAAMAPRGEGHAVSSDSMYLKTPAEMQEALSAWPDAMENATRIAEMCNVSLVPTSRRGPAPPVPADTPDRLLRDLAHDGLANRLGVSFVPAEYLEALDCELDMIAAAGRASAVLILRDALMAGRRQGYLFQPEGRVAGGSLLAHALGIGDLDPTRYALPTWRPAGASLWADAFPGIRASREGRNFLIRYLREKNGEAIPVESGTRAHGRSALQWAANALARERHPDDPIKASEWSRKARDSSTPPQALRALCKFIEGFCLRLVAPGVEIAVFDRPIREQIPTLISEATEMPFTQWGRAVCAEMGANLLAVTGDYSGLSRLERLRAAVCKATGRDVDPTGITPDDPAVFALFQRAETDGVAGFESADMREALQALSPDCFEDLVALVAMYRPGMRDRISAYCRKKHGEEPVDSWHASIDAIVAGTYGLMLYPEQAVSALQALGVTRQDCACAVVNAVAKRELDSVIVAEREDVASRTRALEMTAEFAVRLFDRIIESVRGSYPMANAAHPALTAYRLAYFKLRYPELFEADVREERRHLDDAAEKGGAGG